VYHADRHMKAYTRHRDGTMASVCIQLRAPADFNTYKRITVSGDQASR